MKYRIEKDTMGKVNVPSEKYWGAQTQRSINNFNFQQLKALEKFLDFEDDTIFNFYKYNKIEKNIDKNEISNIFKKFKI